jgi:hypothetical protein
LTRGGSKPRSLEVFTTADSALDVAVTLYDRGVHPATLRRCARRTGLAPPAGLEPATRRLEGGRSIQLSYGGEKDLSGLGCFC